MLRGSGYAREMELDATPAIDAALEPALLAVLDAAGVRTPGSAGYEDAWRRAALYEGVDGDEPPVGYALLPRSTRGATRA